MDQLLRGWVITRAAKGFFILHRDKKNPPRNCWASLVITGSLIELQSTTVVLRFWIWTSVSGPNRVEIYWLFQYARLNFVFEKLTSSSDSVDSIRFVTLFRCWSYTIRSLPFPDWGYFFNVWSVKRDFRKKLWNLKSVTYYIESTKSDELVSFA